MNQHTIVTTYRSEGGSVTVKTETLEADLSQNGEYEIPGSSTDMQINVNIPISTMKSFAFGCSKKTGQASTAIFTGLTIKTNSSSAPSDTFTITPTNGIAWSTGDSNANPIGSAITALYITNDGDAIGNFVVRALLDSTP